MTIEVLQALGLDNGLPAGQILTVDENGTTDGSFILSSLMGQEIKEKHNIILVLFHNSLGHYHCIGQKLGYNLFSLQKSNNVVVIDILEKIESACREGIVNTKEPFSLGDLYMKIKSDVAELSETGPVCLVLENISNLLLLDFSFENVSMFVHYIKTLIQLSTEAKIVMSAHNFDGSKEFNTFLNGLKHISDVTVILNDLKTGKAADVSGTMSLLRKQNDVNKWNEQTVYHYQLLERNVKVFAPGYGPS